MALAGGVTVRVPQRGGYFYTAGSILSPDGHCRPFDAKAQGTIVGSGVGLVVLKRLADALDDGDNIRAVILGVGINNDGSDKVGYTAPSTRGQAAAIRAAHARRGHHAESIGYVEAHGTGTILGDPIELSALTEVFRQHTDRRGFCGIGSVKSNFGHLSCAAGVAGLIKTVLALEHGAIPPTVHYTAPNPAIDLASSPFYVTTRAAAVGAQRVAAPRRRQLVRRRRHQRARRPRGSAAAARRRRASAPAPGPDPLGAERGGARRGDDATRRPPRAHPGDRSRRRGVHAARRAASLQYRRAMVVGSDDRARRVAAPARPGALPAPTAALERPVVFMFPGQGSQYPGMAAGLYKSEAGRAPRDRSLRARRSSRQLGADLRTLLFPPARRRRHGGRRVCATRSGRSRRCSRSATRSRSSGDPGASSPRR